MEPRFCFFVFFGLFGFFFVFWGFRGPRAVKQEKTSQNTETNSKINFIFGARQISFCQFFCSYCDYREFDKHSLA